jgi:acetolactate synthase-1/2/3 large subunit
MTTRSTAHYFLEGLQEIGVEYLFCNLGTDHVSIIEEIARWKQEGRTPPQVILCPHENVAMHMAAGYAMCTGRGQAVLVHVDAGTANAAMGMHNLCRSRVPLLLMAGKAPFTQHGELLGSRDTYVNFLQEPYDMASLVRPYVKWAWDLPAGVVVKEALRRAHTMMHSEPKGPAYLTIAREVLAAGYTPDVIRSYPAQRNGPIQSRGIDDEAIEAIAQRLLTARQPMLITAYAGRNLATPGLIDELAQFTGMRVYEAHPVYLNIPHDSPCFCGFLAASDLHEADFGLLVDVDVPWIPTLARENPDTWWAHVDVDTVKKDFPMWSFPGHLRVQADSQRVIARLLEVMRAKADATYRGEALARLKVLTGRRETAHAAARAEAQPGTMGRINPAYVAAELSRVMGEDDILVHETITNIIPVLTQIRRNKPGTVLGNGGAGLGFGGGVALGAKLAHPDRRVFHVTGDGSFIFSGPTALYMVAKQQDLPILTVVLDNCGWCAVKRATQRVYPAGAAYETGGYQSLLGADTHYEKIAETVGAYGERVEDPEQLRPALARCLAALDEGRPAILIARIEPVEAITQRAVA